MESRVGPSTSTLRIFKSKWFHRFAKREGITDSLLVEAVERAEKGQVDADLGGGVIKQRVARPGQGKAKGYRTIVLFRRNERAFFIYGFAKSQQANVRNDEVAGFKEAAKHVLSLTDSQVARLIENGDFVEVTEHEQEISK